MKVEFKSDGTHIQTPADGVGNTTWKVVGDKLTLHTTQEGNNSTSKQTMTARIVEGNFETGMIGGMFLVFKKQ